MVIDKGCGVNVILILVVCLVFLVCIFIGNVVLVRFSVGWMGFFRFVLLLFFVFLFLDLFVLFLSCVISVIKLVRMVFDCFMVIVVDLLLVFNFGVLVICVINVLRFLMICVLLFLSWCILSLLMGVFIFGIILVGRGCLLFVIFGYFCLNVCSVFISVR